MSGRRRIIVTAIASTVAAALVATLAVLWPGYDARHVPVDNVAVWALQTGDGKRYARVNTELGELDTVKEVDNPSGIAQYGDTALVFTDGQQRFAVVDPATPMNLDESVPDAFDSTPPDTAFVTQEGEWIAFLSSTGKVHVARIDERVGPTGLLELDPYRDDDVDEGEERPVFQANAIAIHPDGSVALAGHGRIIRMSPLTGDVIDEDIVAQVDEGADTDARSQLTFAGDAWVLFDAASGQLWVEDADEPLTVEVLSGALLQSTSVTPGAVFIADTGGMIRVDLVGGEHARVAQASGTPARPFAMRVTDAGRNVEERMFGAWLAEDTGTLWSAEAGIVPLSYNGLVLGEERAPAFVTNGSRAILNEQRSGWVWNLPGGNLLPSSQQWRIDEEQPVVTDEVETQRVTDPKPPVAEPDEFGVRAGRLVTLPVLLNDHDPNEDVLSIIPDSVTGLDPAFGSVEVTNDDQQLVIHVSPDAEGSASFSYRVTDGTTVQGLNSEPASVTLTVIPEEANSAPVWCGTTDCLAEWPSIDVVPGGTASVNVLPGWVDPEGDPFYLRGAGQSVEVGTLLTNPDGTVTYQHPDANSTESLSFTVDLDIVDARGAASVRPLTINVNAGTELAVAPFAVTGAIRQRIHLDFSDHIVRAAGPVTLTSLSALDGRDINARVTGSSLVATVEPPETGTYVLQATVTDGMTEATGIVRVTVVDPATTPISTTPLTAFIHPGEDTTVDIMPAITDPAASVLLISDLEVERDGDASLSVDVIGQRFLRATGETLTGEPGTLGTATFTVSDGSSLPHRNTKGEVTFVLLPPADAIPPIAVDDRVTVRAGAQIDIPVLANDSVPSGAQMQIDPSKIVNEHDAGLAFATSRVLRYLAPDEPGDYSVSYTVFRLGFPSLTDTARVHITVVGDEGNAPPTPPVLEGRVHSGRSVSIPFERFTSDPDGDTVTLDRIVTQPEHGSATISAEGDAIVYTSAPEFAGQIRFTYEVRDDFGDTGIGEVRVGVLDSEVNPSPVTYSDYVQVQVGTDSETVVHPLDNDIEPNGTALTLIDVRPNAPALSTEFDALDERLIDVDTHTGEVRIRAGEELGTGSYVYTVSNESGDVAQGLIIVKVVREPVPDVPFVRDTTLTAETLEQFPLGVDVVTGQVSWATGDVGSLDLGLWGKPEGIAVDGWRILGSIPDRSRIIPFSVTGASFSGTEVTSYGFLRVPGKEDVQLSLRQAYAEVTVDEGDSVDIDLREAVRVPDGAELELLSSDVSASGARAEAVCEAAGDLTVRYRAGKGAPWQDVCRIPVKLATQSNWTYLSLGVRVIAEDPQPELRAATVSVSPGATVTYDLRNMVSWQGQRDLSTLRYATAYQGAEFDVTQEGSTLTITAHDAARPSRQEPVVVSLLSHPEVTANTLNVTVGPAPSTLPRGATVTQQCSQGGGSTSCLIPVIGGGGEVNPLPRTPLKLVAVTGSSNCSAVSFSVENTTTVRATWASDAPGAADCAGTFIVEDAQGRQSTGDRMGQIVLDLQGLPANPATVDWVTYGATSVTLQPVSTTSSYPAVTGYRVRFQGRSVDCPASGTCVIDGLPVGEKITFSATAVNDVGSSRGDASVTAWAYDAPRAPKNATWKPKPAGASGGLAELTVTGVDETTRSLSVRVAGTDGAESIPVSGGSAAFTLPVPNTPSDVVITPITRFDVPPASVGGGSATGKVLTVPGVHGVGAPLISASVSTNLWQRTVTVDATFVANGSATVMYGIAETAASCVPDHTVTADSSNGTTASQRHVFTDVRWGQRLKPVVCAKHDVDGVAFPTATWSPNEGVTLVIPDPTGSLTYTVGRAAVQREDGSWAWPNLSADVGTEQGFELRFDRGNPGDHFLTIHEAFPEPGVHPGTIYAKLCDTSGAQIECGDRLPLSPASGSAPFSPVVSFGQTADADGVCFIDDLTSLVTVTGLPGEASITEVVSADATSKRVLVSFPSYHLDPVESPPCLLTEVSGDDP